MDADATSPFLLAATDVVKHYPARGGAERAVVRAVDGVSLGLRPGATLGLVGESGCGKSTLARLLAGLEEPTSGVVSLKGHDIRHARRGELRRTVQMVFQDPYSSLNPRQSVGSIVGEPLAIHGLGSRAERAARTAAMLEVVGLLPEHARRYPHEFSGGQRQRVAIARALVLDPAAVILDEPVSALDVSIQAQVINLLLDLQARLGLSYLFISHDLAVVGHICDEVAVMYLGRIVEYAPREALFGAPRHPYAQALLAAVPVPEPGRTRELHQLGDELPSPVNPPPGCHFHPRCPHAMEVCRKVYPAWRKVGGTHGAACHLYPE